MRWDLLLCLQAMRKFLAVFVLLMEKPHSQLREAEKLSGAQTTWVPGMQAQVFLFALSLCLSHPVRPLAC